MRSRQVKIRKKRSFGFGHGLVALSAVFAGGATVAGCSGGGSSGGGGVASTSAPITTAGTNSVQVSDISVAGIGSQSISQVQVENGLNSGFQLVIDGTYTDASGANQVIDVTRDATYTTSDDTIVDVSNGLISPKAPGAAEVTIEYTSSTGSTVQKTVQVQVTAPTGTTPNFTSIAVVPDARTLSFVDPATGQEQLQQVAVYAVDDQGVTHDLTRTIAIHLQDDQGNSSNLGAVDARGLFRGVDNGKIWIVGRLQSAGLVAGSEIVLGTGVATPVNPNQLYSGAPLAGSANEFDQAVLDNLFGQFIEPAPLASDGEFLRRLYADAIGRAPSEAEVDAFLASTDADKREQEVDSLLASAEFAAHWGSLLAEWFEMGPEAPAFATWAEGELAGGSSLAQIFADCIEGNQTNFEARHDDPEKKAGIVMQTGTGMTARCAACHDHPLIGPNDTIKWLQSDYYPIVAFFATNNNEATALDGRTDTRVGNPYDPGFPGATVSTTLADPVNARRTEFSTVFPSSDFFARGMGHRIFAKVAAPLLNTDQFLAKELDAVAVPNVLDAITTVFKNENASLQGFLRKIFTSNWYGLTSDSTNMDVQYDNLLQRHMVRRHHAEFMIEAVEQVTGMGTNAANLGFLEGVWGQPETREAIGERSNAVNMSQSLTLMNSPIVQDRINGTKITDLAGDVDGGTITQTEAITKLWRMTLSRDPSSDEITDANDAIAAASSTEEGLQDLTSALMASIEFSMR